MIQMTPSRFSLGLFWRQGADKSSSRRCVSGGGTNGKCDPKRRRFAEFLSDVRPREIYNELR